MIFNPREFTQLIRDPSREINENSWLCGKGKSSGPDLFLAAYSLCSAGFGITYEGPGKNWM